jgi:hypothetical protein
MKIRRTFRKRSYNKGEATPKYSTGGHTCPEGQIWDEATQTCIAIGTGTVLKNQPQLNQGDNGVPDFTSAMHPDITTNKSNNPQPAIPDANTTQPVGIDESTAPDFEMMDLENRGAEAEAFSKELTAQQNKDDANLQAEVEAKQNKELDASIDKGIEDGLLPVATQDESKLFNPYAGVDIPTAAYIAGENWGKGGNKVTAAAATGKFLLGSARNFFSGMGNANRNAQQTKEYNEELARAKRSNFTAIGRDGGVIQSDIDDILNGIDLPMMEEGGEVDIDLLTGSYAKGTNMGDENVELEDGEYLQEPDGTPKKVEGKSHEESDEDGTGEKMNLPDGTEVISNNLKPNKEQRKSIAAEYGIKVRAKDTYANTLEKYHKKIGLYDLIEEEEDIIKEIKNQKEKMAEKGVDEATSNINLEFLSSKLKDIGDEKVELEKMAQEAFNTIFKLQEDSKPKEDTMEQEEFEIGGKVYSKDQIISVANKYGLSEDKAMDIIKKMKPGGTIGDPEKGTKVSVTVAKKKVANGEWERVGVGRYIKRGEPGTEFVTREGIARLDSYKKAWEEEGRVDKSKYPTYNDFVTAAEEYWESRPRTKTTKGTTPGTPDELFYTELKALDVKPIGVKMIETPPDEINLDYIPSWERETEDGTKPAKPIEDVEKDKKKKGASNALLLPENMPLPPQGLQMPTRFTRRYGRMDLQAVSPDQKLAEVDRAFDVVSEQIQNLPSGQKEAALLKLAANTQNKKDEIINAYNVQENQLNQSEEAFNIRQGDREEDARVVDASRFQDQASAAMANTEDDFRRFFNTVQERNTQNFNTINSLNLLNQAYDNFDFGNQGVDFTGGTGSLEEMFASGQFDQAVRTSLNAMRTEKTKEAKAKAKAKKGRRGGRIKRKY